MFVQEVNISQTKYLRTLRVVPTTEAVQVHAFAQTICDVSEQSSHKSEVKCIYWDEGWNIVLFLVVNVSTVLSVNQGCRLFFNSKIDDS